MASTSVLLVQPQGEVLAKIKEELQEVPQTRADPCVIPSLNEMASTSVLLVQPQGEVLAKIKEELQEVPQTRDQCLAIVKEWLKKQPHLPNEWEDACILNFLRGCSFSIERCKRKLDMYFTMRTACPEFFDNRDIRRPELMDLMKSAQIVTLPGLTSNGRRISVCRGLDKKTEALLVNTLKIITMVGDIRLREEVEGVSGDVYIFDMGIVGPNHIAKVSLTMVKKFLICVQAACPIKLKEVHVVNTSPLIDTFYNMIKMVLREKVKNRIFFHKGFTGLHEYISKDILPTEYAGTGCSLEEVSSAWLVKQKEYIGWFQQQESLKANEALRPGKPTNYEEMFGIEGSFRKLNID